MSAQRKWNIDTNLQCLPILPTHHHTNKSNYVQESRLYIVIVLVYYLRPCKLSNFPNKALYCDILTKMKTRIYDVWFSKSIALNIGWFPNLVFQELAASICHTKLWTYWEKGLFDISQVLSSAVSIVSSFFLALYGSKH